MSNRNKPLPWVIPTPKVRPPWPPRPDYGHRGGYRYVIRTHRNGLYPGSTAALINRLVAHFSAQGAGVTQRDGAAELVYVEKLPTNDRLALEKYEDELKAALVDGATATDFLRICPGDIDTIMRDVATETEWRIENAWPPFHCWNNVFWPHLRLAAGGDRIGPPVPYPVPIDEDRRASALIADCQRAMEHNIPVSRLEWEDKSSTLWMHLDAPLVERARFHSRFGR